MGGFFFKSSNLILIGNNTSLFFPLSKLLARYTAVSATSESTEILSFLLKGNKTGTKIPLVFRSLLFFFFFKSTEQLAILKAISILSKSSYTGFDVVARELLSIWTVSGKGNNRFVID